MTRSVSITLCFSVIYATSAVGQSGIISTVGGTFRGFAGDDGPVKSAAFTLANKFNDCDPATYEQTSHLTIDKSGNLYIADTNNHRIRRINPNGIVTTVVGSGLRPEIDQFCGPIGGNAAIGEGGQSKAAKLNGPTQVIFDPSGNMVVVDQQNNRIRRVNAQGVLGTIVGGTLHQFYAPGTPATTTGMDWPIAVAYDAQGVLYFCGTPFQPRGQSGGRWAGDYGCRNRIAGDNGGKRSGYQRRSEQASGACIRRCWQPLRDRANQ